MQEHFKIYFNSNENKYRSIAFCYSNFVSLLTYEDHNGISIFTVTKSQFYEYPITVALVYRSPNTPVAGFLDRLIYFTNARKIDILLGDFNVDAFDSDACAKLHYILSNYRLVVKEPIDLDGALLGHIYLHKLFLSKNVNALVKNIYFSDHDAVNWKYWLEEMMTSISKEPCKTTVKHNLKLETLNYKSHFLAN